MDCTDEELCSRFQLLSLSDGDSTVDKTRAQDDPDEPSEFRRAGLVHDLICLPIKFMNTFYTAAAALRPILAMWK